ncbi:MAG: enoyl-CoA hydratase/isomerase family protein [Lysinibacillus sp.]
MKFNYVTLNIQDGIATVTLHHQLRQNEFTAEFSQELAAVANYLKDTKDVKVVVVQSSLDDFSIGMTVEATQYEQIEDEYKTVSLAAAAIREWEKLPYPIIAAINGTCRSLAFSFVTVADIRIVADNAVFSMPEVTWGVIPAGGISQRLPRLIGKGPAMSVLLGAKTVRADEALALGLATSKVSNEELSDAAYQEAQLLSNLSALSLQYTKECLIRGSELPFDQGLRLELDVYMTLQTSRDRMEGIQAFLEKRAPNFVGE